MDRSGYTALKTALLRRGDTLVVKSLDRLSRNKADIKNELQYFKDNGIRLKILDLPTTMVDYPAGQEWVLEMVNNVLIEVLSSIAMQERETIRQRCAGCERRADDLRYVYVYKLDELTQTMWLRADVDGDRSVNVQDVQYLLKLLVE